MGGSGGAAVAGALAYARQSCKAGDKVLVFLADAGHKYMSKIFNDDWMRENGFLEDSPGAGTVRDLLVARDRAGRELVTAAPAAKVREVIATLKSHGISQLPVVENGKLRGIVAEVDLLRHLVSGHKTLDSSIDELVEGDYADGHPEYEDRAPPGGPRRTRRSPSWRTACLQVVGIVDEDRPPHRLSRQKSIPTPLPKA